jgi:stage II sporulation protein E
MIGWKGVHAMSRVTVTEHASGFGNRSATLPRWPIQAWPRVFLLSAIAILLGRASILHVVSPFLFAYYIILFELAGRKRSWPAYLGLVGAWTIGGPNLAIQILVEIVLYRLVRRGVFRMNSPDLPFIPLIGGLVASVTHLAMVGTVWSKYDMMLALADGALVMILCLIFLQCMAIFIGQDQTKNLKSEQVLSLVILAGSIMTGFSGLTFHDIPAAQVALDWLVSILACGGMGIGAGGAIVVSMLGLLNHADTLSTVAILGFSGLLAGVLKDAPRFWVGLTFFISTGVLTLAEAPNMHVLFVTSIASGIGVFLYWLTPPRFIRGLKAYMPGTEEYQSSERQRVKRVNALLLEKINEIGQVFDELSAAFAETGESQSVTKKQLMDQVVGAAARDVCATCPRRSKCWEKEGMQTYQDIAESAAKLDGNMKLGINGATKGLRERCVRLDPMMNVLKHNLEITERDTKWIAKLEEYKTLVSAQLAGVAAVIRTMASEIDAGNKTSLSGGDQIVSALEQLGLYVDDVHIVNLDPGKVEIEVTQPTQGAYEKSARVIAPMLSGIVGENITVSKVMGAAPGPCTSVFTSASLYHVTTAVASVAKDGRIISGDTHTSMDLGNGRFAVAVSDGMGNGERAKLESKAAIDLLKKLLKAGFDEKLAIRTVNSTLLLRSTDEMFTTLDMALIDLFTANTEFLKIGSAPSFVKRGTLVQAITGSNVPIGILQDIEVQSIEEQLRDGDILIMMSDGVYDAPRQLYDKEEWLKKQIERLETDDPQEIADTLLEIAIRTNQGEITDDMTVVVANIQADEPEWATIKLPGVQGLRKKTDHKKRGA